jgi:chromosome segregation ATPase
MSNDATLAADAFKRFAAQFGGIFKGFELLGEIGSAETVLADAQQRLKAAQEQIAVLKQEAAEAERELEAKQELLERLNSALARVSDGELQLQSLQGKIVNAQIRAAAAESDARNKQRELDKINAALAKLHTASK